MFKVLLRGLCAFAVLAQANAALADVIPIELEDVRHQRATLVVAGENGDVSYDPQALEALGAMRMSTITPWRETPADFDGVLLNDLLEANGLSDASKIKVIAENGFATEIDASTWKRWPILVATRVNGKPHSRRARGPIQFVMPMSDDPQVGDGLYVSNWVWMAARIEVVE